MNMHPATAIATKTEVTHMLYTLERGKPTQPSSLAPQA